MSEPTYWGVVPAAGRGSRMGGDCPKQYLPLLGQTVIEQSLSRLLSWNRLRTVMVALHPEDRQFSRLGVARDPRIAHCSGGEQRADSVLEALRALSEWAEAGDWVLVHDAARPCIKQRDLQNLAEALHDDEVGGLLACPVGDTVKRADRQQRVSATVDRRRLWLAQTPQMFRFQLLHDALSSARRSGSVVTDEAAAVERAGFSPRLITGDAGNIKITVAQDLLRAEAWLQGEGST